MGTNTEVKEHGYLRLWLCLLFVVSFAVSVVVLRPTTVAPSLAGVTPTEVTQEFVRAVSSPEADVRAASTLAFDDPEQPAAPAPTLQDLAMDGDPETSLEAQTLLALVDAEAAAEYLY